MSEYHLNLIFNPTLDICTKSGRFELYDTNIDLFYRSRQWVKDKVQGGGWGSALNQEDQKAPLDLFSKDSDSEDNTIIIAIGVRKPENEQFDIQSLSCYTTVCRKAKAENSNVMTASPFKEEKPGSHPRMTVFPNINNDQTQTHVEGYDDSTGFRWYPQRLGNVTKRPDWVPLTDNRIFELAIAVIIQYHYRNEDHKVYLGHDPEMQVRD